MCSCIWRGFFGPSETRRKRTLKKPGWQINMKEIYQINKNRKDSLKPAIRKKITLDKRRSNLHWSKKANPNWKDIRFFSVLTTKRILLTSTFLLHVEQTNDKTINKESLYVKNSSFLFYCFTSSLFWLAGDLIELFGFFQSHMLINKPLLSTHCLVLGK